MLLLALPPSPCPTDTSRRPHRELSVVLDNRNSFLRESAVKIIDLNVGVKLNPRWRLGLGAYTLRHDYAEQFLYNKSRKVTARLAPDLSLTYLTPNLTWTFWRRHYFEVSWAWAAATTPSITKPKTWWCRSAGACSCPPKSGWACCSSPRAGWG